MSFAPLSSRTIAARGPCVSLPRLSTAMLLEASLSRCHFERRGSRTAHAHHAVPISSLLDVLSACRCMSMRKVLPTTCSQRHQFSQAALVQETGQWIFDKTIFGIKFRVSAASPRARSLSSAIVCKRDALLCICGALMHATANPARYRHCILRESRFLRHMRA